MASASHHNFVILGANHAGLRVAHGLLSKQIPLLKKLLPGTTYHVTIISPSTHFYQKIASVRTVAKLSDVPVEKILVPFADAFKEYDEKDYTIVYAFASGIDVAGKTVQTTFPKTNAAGPSVPYNTLVITTGTTTDSRVWTLGESHEETASALKEIAAQVAKAGTMLIAGGGPAGVETAAEVAARNKNVKVELVSGADRVMPRLLPKTSAKVDKVLKGLGVTVTNNVKVTGSEKRSDGKTQVTLSDGTSKVVDVYLSAITAPPNTSFLPSSWLSDTDKRVLVDDTLRVQAPDAKGVYSMGDAATLSGGAMFGVMMGAPVVLNTIVIDVLSNAPAAEKGTPEAQAQDESIMAWFLSLLGFGSSKAPKVPKQTHFKLPVNGQVLSLGNTGAGEIAGFQVPGFLAWQIKGKNLFVSAVPGYLKGQ